MDSKLTNAHRVVNAKTWRPKFKAETATEAEMDAAVARIKARQVAESLATCEVRRVAPRTHWSEYPCAHYDGVLTPKGYASKYRAVYEAERGPVPDGMDLDHLCRNRACFNPYHLEPVTHSENMRRSWGARRGECWW